MRRPLRFSELEKLGEQLEAMDVESHPQRMDDLLKAVFLEQLPILLEKDRLWLARELAFYIACFEVEAQQKRGRDEALRIRREVEALLDVMDEQLLDDVEKLTTALKDAPRHLGAKGGRSKHTLQRKRALELARVRLAQCQRRPSRASVAQAVLNGLKSEMPECRLTVRTIDAWLKANISGDSFAARKPTQTA